MSTHISSNWNGMARILILLALSATSVADAALIAWPEIVERSLPGAPAGHVVNGMLINFDGQLFGQQLIVELTSGSIYQDPFGATAAPSSALWAVWPSAMSDTFVVIGGWPPNAVNPLLPALVRLR